MDQVGGVAGGDDAAGANANVVDGSHRGLDAGTRALKPGEIVFAFETRGKVSQPVEVQVPRNCPCVSCREGVTVGV